jgi:hypothetical protein
MNKVLCFFCILFFLSPISYGQRISAKDNKLLQKKEDSLKKFAYQILYGRNAEDRFAADSQFTKTFVRALQIKNSFYYLFDSLVTIAKVVPPDSSFKIFTWQLAVNGDVIRKHGAIQMNTKDGRLKLFPLIDKTDIIKNQEDTVTSNEAWIGALYYKVIEEKAFDKTYYTLLGFDDNNMVSDRKIIDVLTFKDGKPVFGGPYFSLKNNSTINKPKDRYILEFKKNASPKLSYDDEMGIIIFEHLVSETGEPKKKYTYIPDGDYEGLEWKDGKWVYIEKIFNQKTPEGQEPVPHPILDARGNIDESKLSQRRPEEQDSNQNKINENSEPQSEKK